MEIGISKYIQNRIIKKNQNEQLKTINKKNTLSTQILMVSNWVS